MIDQSLHMLFLGVSAIGRTLSLASTGISAPIVASIGNLGDAPVGAFNVEFRFSSDTTWGNQDDIVIGSSSLTGLTALGGTGPSGTIAFTFNFDTIKARLPAGNYYLGVTIDPTTRLSEGGAKRTNNTWWSSAADWVITA